MARFIDYEYKSKILSSPNFQEYKKYYSIFIKSYLMFKTGEVFNDKIYSQEDYDFACSVLTHLEEIDNKAYKEFVRISHSHSQRVCRLKKRITKILTSGDCLFLTFTFTDNSLETISPFNRRRYVTRFLSELNCSYVANIDFGKKNHREHYHAVVGIDRVDYSKWKYGAINGLKIRNQSDDIKKIARYIAKLTNHAIKETTKRNVLIYSREKMENNYE